MALLAIATLLLFRPDALMDRLYPEYSAAPAARVFDFAKAVEEDGRIVLRIGGTTLEGKDVTKTVALQLGAPGDGRKRLADAGLQLVPLGPEVQIGAVKFGSRAQKSGFEQGWNDPRGPGAERPAFAPLVLPAGAAAGGAGLVRAGPAHARRTGAGNGLSRWRHAGHEGLRRSRCRCAGATWTPWRT